MGRRRYSEKDVLRTLLHQGVQITDFRTGEPITLENVVRVQREHLVELGLAKTDAEKRKYDQPEYCRYSLAENHKAVTSGTGATTAGSSIGRISKAKRIERTGKMAVDKPPVAGRPLCSDCGLEDGACICAHLGGRRRQRVSRPIPSCPFPQRKRAKAWPKRKMRGRA